MIFNSVGRIYEYSNKNEVHLAITKLEHLKWIIENVFAKYPFFTTYQWERFCRLRYGVLNRFHRVESLSEYQDFLEDRATWLIPLDQVVSDPTEIEGFDDWLSGFINGEGSFSIRANAGFIFDIEHTDKTVIELIRKRFDFNPKVNLRPGRKANRKDTYSLNISSKRDLETIIQFCSNKEGFPSSRV